MNSKPILVTCAFRLDCPEMSIDDASLRRLYPFESRFLERPGGRLHYVDEGSGPPVVFVHGNPTWSFYYRELIKALRPDHRCVALDHIGCGLSDKPGDDAYEYVLDRRVDDLEALLDHLGLESEVTLVLHDWGGMIGMACALRRPERIGRIVLLNTAAFLLPQAKPLPRRLRVVRRGPIGPILIRGFNAFARGAIHIAVRRRMPADVRAAYLGPYNSWRNRIATLRFVQDIPLGPSDRSFETAKRVDENLHRFADVPTMIFWGERDVVFDRHFLDEWRRRFPKAVVHTFDDAGHYVLEDAAERIVPLVRAFIRA